MAIDRAATVKKAEGLLGEGKLEAAIAEYVRLVEEQPGDASFGNILGDLYIRIGDKDKAVAQFAQVADAQYRQGFTQKAAAFYKKALRVKSGDEHSLAQLAAIAAQQELLADARMYMNLLLKQRRERGDAPGVAEGLIRLSALDDDDVDAKLAAARAGIGHIDSERVARLFLAAAEIFEKRGNPEQMKAVAVEASALAIHNPELRRRIEELAGAASSESEAVAQPNVSEMVAAPETVTTTEPAAPVTETIAPVETPTPAPAPMVLEVETSSGITLSFHDSQSDPVASRADGTELQPKPTAERQLDDHPPEAPHVDLMAMLDDASTAMLDEASARVSDDQEAPRFELVDDDAQEAPGAVPEWNIPALESSASEIHLTPTVPSVEDVPAAPVMAPPPPVITPPPVVEPPPAVAAPPPVPTPPIVTPAPDVRPTPIAATAPIPAPAPSVTNAPIAAEPPKAPPAPAIPKPPSGAPISSEAKTRFEEMLARSRRQARPRGDEPAAAPADRGNHDGDVVAQLKAAAASPNLQFQASAQLGRLFIERGDLRAGVEWLERAVQAPVQIPEHANAVLYEMADALERLGEHARALDALRELEANAGTFRDVQQRIARLAAGRPGGHGS